jgi:hypothetical protein
MKTISPTAYRRSQCLAVSLALFLTIVIAPVIAFGAPRPTPTPTPEPQLDLAVAATVMQHAIAKYQTTATPKLESADLIFKVTSGKQIGVGFSFWIITFGATRTEIDVRTVSFNYKVPGSDKPAQSPSPAATTPTMTPTLSPTATPASVTAQFNKELFDVNTLANLDLESFAEKDINLLAASVATRSGYQAPNMKKFQDDLTKAIDAAAKAARETPKIGGAEFQTFAVSIDYSVKWEGSGSASIPVFSVLTIGPKGSISRDTAHTLKLTFRK